MNAIDYFREKLHLRYSTISAGNCTVKWKLRKYISPVNFKGGVLKGKWGQSFFQPSFFFLLHIFFAKIRHFFFLKHASNCHFLPPVRFSPCTPSGIGHPILLLTIYSPKCVVSFGCILFLNHFCRGSFSAYAKFPKNLIRTKCVFAIL